MPTESHVDPTGGYEAEGLAPVYSDDVVTLYKGDARATLAELPAESVDCIVTSPPYFGLRDYGVEGQYGLEDSPAAYVETMRAVFAEARRVLAKDGTLWLNVGDSYYSGRGNPGPNSADEKQAARRGWVRPVDRPGAGWAKPKDLLGIPWRVAFALQDDGWTLRNAIVWHKPNAMPESVTDRLSSRYEPIFLFSRSRRYHFDLDAIREPVIYPQLIAESPPIVAADATPYAPGMPPQRGRARTGKRRVHGGNQNQTARHQAASDNTGWKAHEPEPHPNGKNPGDVWSIVTTPFAEAHFAVMPAALAERCILAGCKRGGVVLDPFSGSGTTGMAATKLGRRYVGIDLNGEYLDLSLRTRLAQSTLCDAPLDDGVVA